MRPLRRLLPGLLSVALATPAAAQLHSADSLAVIRAVQRYHGLLVASDTGGLSSVIAHGATIIFRGDAAPLTGEALAATIRWDRAITRDSSKVTARVLGSGAYVYTISRFAARGAPISGIEIESIFLSRIGTTWLVEMVHRTAGDAP